MRHVTAEQRRATLVARHHLGADAPGPLAVARALVALHGTDPASVHLAVLARSRASTLQDVSGVLHVDRALVRWMAMRRTVFVLPREDVPWVHAAVGAPVAAALRRRLLALIGRNGIDTPVEGDLADWLGEVEQRVERAVADRGGATGAELRAAVPALRAAVPPRTRSEARLGLTSPLLTVLSAEGRLVRGAPTGAWTSRGARWEPVSAWWPEGLPRVDPAEAEARLARRWLERFGPATAEDLAWWTGWSRTTTRRALAALDLEDVDLHDRPGVDLRGAEPAAQQEPAAALLPALDPTVMGWRYREWFTAVDPAPLRDAAGNVGPTIWWSGELVGGWASTATGIRTRLLADRGGAAADAVEAAAAVLHERLEGTVVTPAARTPLERELNR